MHAGNSHTLFLSFPQKAVTDLIGLTSELCHRKTIQRLTGSKSLLGEDGYTCQQAVHHMLKDNVIFKEKNTPKKLQQYFVHFFTHQGFGMVTTTYSIHDLQIFINNNMLFNFIYRPIFTCYTMDYFSLQVTNTPQKLQIMHTPFYSIKDVVLMFVVMPWGGNKHLAPANSTHPNERRLVRMETLTLIRSKFKRSRDLYDVCLPQGVITTLK